MLSGLRRGTGRVSLLIKDETQALLAMISADSDLSFAKARNFEKFICGVKSPLRNLQGSSIFLSTIIKSLLCQHPKLAAGLCGDHP